MSKIIKVMDERENQKQKQEKTKNKTRGTEAIAKEWETVRDADN